MLPIKIIEEKMDDSKLGFIEEVWDMLSYQLSIPKLESRKILEEVISKYSEPHRSYHNLSHIYSMLMMAEDYYDFIGNPILFELSMWFHDLIYDPNKNDNETKRIHYYNLGGSYTLGAQRFALNYGRQRGGLVCIGGVCRFVPESTGLTANIVLSF